MKKHKILLLLLAAAFAAPTQAQFCQFGNAKSTIRPNRIGAVINQGGQLFTTGSDAGFWPTTPVGATNVGSIFAAALWVGGVDPAGNLKLSAADYAPGYFAGPIDAAHDSVSTADCVNWNRVFTVKGARISQFLAALGSPNPPTPQGFPEIFGWPGRKNPHFAGVNGFSLPANNQYFAPFFDANNDGVYDPLVGDYPVVELRGIWPFVPAEIAWCVFNDQGNGLPSPSGGKSLQLEIQLTAWGFDCPDRPVLNNTIFTSHKIINRAHERTDSVFVGMWVDFDLGCFEDDYLGCNPSKNCFFTYNQDAVDGNAGGNCSFGLPSFGNQIPVQTAAFLGRSMDKFIIYHNPSVGVPIPATTDPATPLEMYNYLNARWRDNLPLTFGGVGYNPSQSASTDFAFAGDPADPNAWTMCSANLPTGDRRSLASTKLGSLLPGQVEEFNMAYTTHWPSASYLPCSIAGALGDVDAVRVAYLENFADVCSGLVAAPERPEADFSKISIQPNPSGGHFRVVLGDFQAQQIRVFSADGRLVGSVANPQGEQAELRLDGLAAGVYVVQISGAAGVVSRRLVVK